MNKADIKEMALSFFFPKRCRFCDRVIDFRRNECRECADDMGRITGDVCLLCGYMKKDCFCEEHKHYYKAVLAPFYYEGAAGKAIRRLKHVADESALSMFGEEMADIFQIHFSDISFDLVTSVPLSDAAYKKRGYNQAELLARAFAARASLSYSETLIKAYDTKQQHTLSKTERTGNLLGIFESFIGDNLKGKCIVLCDDVKTTGSTLDECAKTLLIAGASEVVCICAAITRHEKR